MITLSFQNIVKKKIQYLCSAFDLESLKFLVDRIKVKIIKIPSGEITSIDMLKYLSKIKTKKIILSTGMSTFLDIKKALKILNFKKKEIILLHCVSAYPAPHKNLNLHLIKALKKNFRCEVGYSDHSNDILASQVAVAIGSKVIEKHVTLSKNDEGPDHKSSVEISEFKKMVSNIREIEKMFRENKKKILKIEKNTQDVSRKSLVSSIDLKKGTVMKKKFFQYKRPGTGISPMVVNQYVGKILIKDIKANKIFKKNYFK